MTDARRHRSDPRAHRVRPPLPGGGQLARGGMGTVWRAHDERLSRPVAVKVLHAVGLRGEPRTARRRGPGPRPARPSHIAVVYDVGTADGADYLVMELIDGRAVGSVLAERGHLSWPEATLVCAQVADALASAHARGVVHRDVTAGNVMLTPSGVKLVDFGLSTNAGAPEADGDGNLMGRRRTWLPNASTATRSRRAATCTPWACCSTVPVRAVAVAGDLGGATAGRAPGRRAGTPAGDRGPARRRPRRGPAVPARDPGDRPTAAQVAQVLQAAASVAADSAPVATGGDATDPLPVTQFLAARYSATAAVRPARAPPLTPARRRRGGGRRRPPLRDAGLGKPRPYGQRPDPAAGSGRGHLRYRLRGHLTGNWRMTGSTSPR